MFFTMLRRINSQFSFYLFWIPLLVFAAYGSTRLSSEQSLFAWNMNLCLRLFFVATIAVTRFCLMLILSVVAAASCIGFFLLGARLPFIQSVINGGGFYLIGLAIAPFLAMARFRLFRDNVRMRIQIAEQNEARRSRVKNGHVVIEVSDTGVGMSREKLDKLFSIRVRQSTMGTEGELGSGLGLIISRDFAERNGGSLTVESVPDRGTSFFLSLPVVT